MTLDQLFLKYLKIENFGVFSNKIVGSFEPGMNLVFGKNEAGKTTLSAFFGGVLFGWEEARGARNTYKPNNAERSGSLFFEDTETHEEFEFSRVKNADGLQGSASFIDDIDKGTYTTMFALTSDELRSLRNTTDVTAKLLTAGSGTSASPAQALIELQSRIAEYSSKAAGFEHSLVRLDQRKNELRRAIADAASEAERFKKQDKEFHELAPQREALLENLETLNSEIEALTARKAGLEKLQTQLKKNLLQRENLLGEEQVLVVERRQYEQEHQGELYQLDQAAEYALRDRIDALFEEYTKLEHRLSVAKETYTESKSAYEGLLEADDVQELERKINNQRKTQLTLSVLLPLFFVLAGIPLFLHGRDINSLSFTALGICLIVFAALLAGAALAMLFRPNKTAEALEQRKKDAQWVMLQDKKKFETCEENLKTEQAFIEKFLIEKGLEAAHGSLRRARIILDEVKDGRTQNSLFVQKQRALISQLSSIEDTLTDIKDQKEKLFGELLMKPETSLVDIESLIKQKVRQRVALTETSASVNRRYGELKQELSQAKNMKEFDALKLAYQQIETRQRESSKGYARLLLAKKSLERAISAWESKSQPEVYRQASRLLSMMTKKRWTQVRMTQEGQLQVIDDVKTVREPTRLSLGTCQQLYLSLRIALLMTADNVGRIIPILADDILVNFDSDRRVGAAQALFELSSKRQVILFTCHEEIVRLMQTFDSQVNVLEL